MKKATQLNRNNASMYTARIILGVTGGIAAFKSLNILRQLKKQGHDVIVVPTENALKMVGKTSFEALSAHPVSYSIFDHEKGYGHIELADWADLVIVAPTTANFIAKMATGITDDLLSGILLATKKPVVIAPAMHTNMYEHPATQQNLQTLKNRGIKIIEPVIGELTNGDTGKGRLAEETLIVSQSLSELKTKDLKGKKVLITAGGTKEYIDPVRFITNSSSGKQGIAIVEEVKSRGGEVTLIACNIEATLPSEINLIKVETANELYEKVLEEYEKAEIIIMCAAVSDWTVKYPSELKLKKQDSVETLELSLIKTKDILKEISQKNAENQEKIIVGFAAETGDKETVLQYGREKILRKNCDLLVVNPVSKTKGFGKNTNEIYILDKQGKILAENNADKKDTAKTIIDTIKLFKK